MAPDVRRLLDLLNARPSVETLDPAAARAHSLERATAAAAAATEIPVALVDELTTDGPVPVRLRRYDPSPGEVGPLLLFFHGGGWVICDLDTHDTVCRSLAAGTGATVLSVDYRRAPEDPFPAGLDDCYSATTWAVDHAAELAVDPRRVAVAGDSAGANLAAATTLLACDRGGPAIVHQTLIYPVLDHVFDTGSYGEFAEGYNITRAAMRWYWEQYLSGGASGSDPLVSPLRAPDLTGLPPALVVTAEYDPLRDEGEAYARRLDEAGVDARLLRAPGLFHGFFSCFDVIESVDALRPEIVGHLRSALT